MKAAKNNLLLFLIPAGICFVLGVVMLISGNVILESAKSMIPQNTGDEIGDVEGYAMLIDLFGAGFAGLAGLIFYMGGVILTPYSGLVIAITIIARLIYKKTSGRILAYRIIMGIDFAVLILPPVFLLVISLMEGTAVSVALFYLAGAAAMLVAGCRWTYTDRILK